MLVLDYKSSPVSCNSLGNIAAQMLAVEWLRQRGENVCVIPSDFHRDVWMMLPHAIWDGLPCKNSVVVVPQPRLHERVANGLSWIETAIVEAGAEGDSFSLTPDVIWTHDANSRNVLIYPREHDNANAVFDLDWWVICCREMIRCGAKIMAIFEQGNNARDVAERGYTSDFARAFLERVPVTMVLPSTIGGIQAGAGLCRLAVGRFTGPGWLLLKSSIRQIALDSVNDFPFCKVSYHVSRGVLGKGIAVCDNTEMTKVLSLVSDLLGEKK